jgi:hypothetical protein
MSQSKKYMLEEGDIVEFIFTEFVIKDITPKGVAWAVDLVDDRKKPIDDFLGLYISLHSGTVKPKLNLVVSKSISPKMFSGVVSMLFKNDSKRNLVYVNRLYKKQPSARILIELYSGDYAICAQSLIKKIEDEV